MNKEWVTVRETEYTAIAQVRRAEILEKINRSNFLTDEDKKTLENLLDNECDKPCWTKFSSTTPTLIFTKRGNGQPP